MDRYLNNSRTLIWNTKTEKLGGGGGVNELMDGWVCAILALEVVTKNLIFA